MCVHVEGGRQISWRMPFNWLGGCGVHQDVPAGIVLLVLSYIYIYIDIHTYMILSICLGHVCRFILLVCHIL